MPWKLPYPIEEQDARCMCGDPIAIAYNKFEIWLKEQNFKPILTVEELIDAIWHEEFASIMNKYDIIRNEKIVLWEIPQYLWDARFDLFQMKEK